MERSRPYNTLAENSNKKKLGQSLLLLQTLPAEIVCHAEVAHEIIQNLSLPPDVRVHNALLSFAWNTTKNSYLQHENFFNCSLCKNRVERRDGGCDGKTIEVGTATTLCECKLVSHRRNALRDVQAETAADSLEKSEMSAMNT
jgi:hypothetical protein